MIRAAVDVGSGATKVAVVSLLQNGKIDKIIFQKEFEVRLAEDLERSGGKELSQRALDHCKSKLDECLQLARQHGLDQNVALKGIGTQVFRTASNGANFFHNLGDSFDLRIISQEEEGRLGFQTACALTRQGIESESIVSWDSGGGSFQLAFFDLRKLHVLKGPLGSSIVTAAAVRLQGKDFSQVLSPNPMTLADVDALRNHIQQILSKIPDLADESCLKVCQSRSIVAIGASTCAFNIALRAVNTTVDPQASNVSWNMLGQAIENLCDKSDSTLIKMGFTPELQPEMVVPKAVLVHTVMEILGIQCFEYKFSVGSCIGLLANDLNIENK